MNTQSLINELKAAKAYCQEQNGRDDCKNCGIEHWDEIVKALEEFAEANKSFLQVKRLLRKRGII